MKEPAVKITLPGHKIYNTDVYAHTFQVATIRQLANVIDNNDEKLLYNIVQKHVNIDIKLLTTYDFEYLLH